MKKKKRHAPGSLLSGTCRKARGLAPADDLLANRAAVVNYERVDLPEQRRICDFINGVSYVLDCEARRISDIMVLYVPSGVDVSTAKPKPVQ